MVNLFSLRGSFYIFISSFMPLDFKSKLESSSLYQSYKEMPQGFLLELSYCYFKTLVLLGFILHVKNGSISFKISIFTFLYSNTSSWLKNQIVSKQSPALTTATPHHPDFPKFHLTFTSLLTGCDVPSSVHLIDFRHAVLPAS